MTQSDEINKMHPEQQTSAKEREAIEHVRKLRGFYQHLITYLVIVSGLILANLILAPEYLWSLWAALGWGVGITSHAIRTFKPFSIFGPEWEKKQVEKRMGKK
ncbi:2TM domain-containing protein [Microbulbifer echini]|uniref:2TM domain-containing protein n=1 Tax=Microbulbifer echini TaxID=1529067 RepID=A0ABV4NND4_9GAMM|nr:2TM domain-containing protein [uncultured Microbulbifer sp.]